MQEMGLEPTRYCYHRHLKPARLPIPPLLRTSVILHGFTFSVNHFFKFFSKNYNNHVFLIYFKFLKKVVDIEPL